MGYNAWNNSLSVYNDSNQQSIQNDSVHIETCHELINNWTMPNFGLFVEECEELVKQIVVL